jgi:hypothetical protein
MGLAACSGEDTATTTTTAPAPVASVAPSATSAPVRAVPSSSGASDKEICASVKKAGDKMKTELIAALQSGGDPSPALFKKILTDMNEEMDRLAAVGGDSEVAATLTKFGKEAAKAASSADPAGAADNPEFEKAGADITAACEPTGVDVNF